LHSSEGIGNQDDQNRTTTSLHGGAQEIYTEKYKVLRDSAHSPLSFKHLLQASECVCGDVKKYKGIAISSQFQFQFHFLIPYDSKCEGKDFSLRDPPLFIPTVMARPGLHPHSSQSLHGQMLPSPDIITRPSHKRSTWPKRSSLVSAR